MAILIINAGSSSLRFALFDDKLKEIYKGHMDGIGQKKCSYRHYLKKGEEKLELPAQNHETAIHFILKTLKKESIIKDLSTIQKVGHRVVHGGEKYQKPALLTAKVLRDLDKLSTLAPLHNPINLLTAKVCQKALPKANHYAIFDTAFHSTLPEKAYLYGLPYTLYQKEKIRRCGFHGESHKYVSLEATRLLNAPLLKKRQLALITCHMGNGISLAAIKNGKVLDTTMGFTPLEGPMMGTRSGTLDPGIIFHLLQKNSPQKVRSLLEHESGLKGLSGISSDIRNLRAKPKDPGTKRAFGVLTYQIAKSILSLTAALGELPDALIFTAGIGENAHYLRKQILEQIPLDIRLDPKANRKNATRISTQSSAITVLVIPTQEELQMAREIL